MNVFRLRRGALAAVADSASVRKALDREAENIQDRARSNARVISPRLSSAIVATPAERTAAGVEARVGYDKHQPGFALWWHEVGTRNYPASPHLRPALRGRS